MNAFEDFVLRFRERQRENELEDRRLGSSLASTAEGDATVEPARAKTEISTRDPALSLR